MRQREQVLTCDVPGCKTHPAVESESEGWSSITVDTKGGKMVKGDICPDHTIALVSPSMQERKRPGKKPAQAQISEADAAAVG